MADEDAPVGAKKDEAGAPAKNDDDGIINLPKSVYESTKADMLKYKDEKRALQAKLDEIEKAKAEAEKRSLEDQARYKELYEKEQKEKADAITKLHQSALVNAVKLEAVRQGIANPNDKNLIGLDGVTVDEIGNVAGVEDAVKKLKADQPHLFKAGTTEVPPDSVRGGKPGGAKNFDGITWKDLTKDYNMMLDVQKNHPALYLKLKKEWEEKIA